MQNWWMLFILVNRELRRIDRYLPRYFTIARKFLFHTTLRKHFEIKPRGSYISFCSIMGFKNYWGKKFQTEKYKTKYWYFTESGKAWNENCLLQHDEERNIEKWLYFIFIKSHPNPPYRKVISPIWKSTQSYRNF